MLVAHVVIVVSCWQQQASNVASKHPRRHDGSGGAAVVRSWQPLCPT